VEKNKIKLRSIKPEDEEFLYQVYASTREVEMAMVDWTKEQIETFLRMQFNAQHKHYQENYVGSKFDIILEGNTPVGRLYVARWEKEIRIIDISLLPEFRRKGIGSLFLKDIMAEAALDGKPVSIHVEHFNPALRLYNKLGFRKIDDTGAYFLMEWKEDLC
jgi:GNAT superfamily N-acetyltransferase